MTRKVKNNPKRFSGHWHYKGSGTPFLTPKSPPKVYVGPFGVLSQALRHINFFGGGPKCGVLGGGQKVCIENVSCSYLSPTPERLDP